MPEGSCWHLGWRWMLGSVHFSRDCGIDAVPEGSQLDLGWDWILGLMLPEVVALGGSYSHCQGLPIPFPIPLPTGSHSHS